MNENETLFLLNKILDQEIIKINTENDSNSDVLVASNKANKNI